VFRNNRNKQKTNRNSSKFVKISTFLIPHTLSSVCFGCFDNGPKHKNKPKKKLFGFAKNKPKNNRNRLIFGMFWFEPRKKKLLFRGPPNIKRFLEFFQFVLTKLCLFRLFRYRSETPKQTEIKVFWFHETNQKTTETDWVSVCFGLNRKKNLIVSRTP
jgi:hypothetical protein